MQHEVSNSKLHKKGAAKGKRSEKGLKKPFSLSGEKKRSVSFGPGPGPDKTKKRTSSHHGGKEEEEEMEMDDENEEAEEVKMTSEVIRPKSKTIDFSKHEAEFGRDKYILGNFL